MKTIKVTSCIKKDKSIIIEAKKIDENKKRVLNQDKDKGPESNKMKRKKEY